MEQKNKFSWKNLGIAVATGAVIGAAEGLIKALWKKCHLRKQMKNDELSRRWLNYDFDNYRILNGRGEVVKDFSECKDPEDEMLKSFIHGFLS